MGRWAEDEARELCETRVGSVRGGTVDALEVWVGLGAGDEARDGGLNASGGEASAEAEEDANASPRDAAATRCAPTLTVTSGRCNS